MAEKTFKPGPPARLRNPVSKGILIEMHEVEALRRAANRRDRSLSSLLRVLVRDFLEAEEQRVETARNSGPNKKEAANA